MRMWAPSLGTCARRSSDWKCFFRPSMMHESECTTWAVMNTVWRESGRVSFMQEAERPPLSDTDLSIGWLSSGDDYSRCRGELSDEQTHWLTDCGPIRAESRSRLFLAALNGNIPKGENVVNCFLAGSEVRRSIHVLYLSVKYEATAGSWLSSLSIKTGNKVETWALRCPPIPVNTTVMSERYICS